MPGQPGAFISASAARQRARDQQAVLNRLRSGQGISGARPADPIISAIQALTGVGAGAIPTLYATAKRGQEQLVAKGGWNPVTAGSGPINVGGQTWYPAQSGQDLIYKRAPGNVGGQYGSVLSKDQLQPPAVPDLPSNTDLAAERAYQTEKSRVAQLAAQNPELQRYEAARKVAKTQEEMNAVRDEGMRIWAARHGGLAANVKPGSTGYEAIQGAVGPGTPSALSNEQVLGVMSFDPNTVLTTTQNIQSQFRPNQQLTDQEILAAMSFDPNVAMSSASNIAYSPMSTTEAAMLKAVGGEQGEYITPMNAIGSPDQAGVSFITPAEQRRRDSSALFQALLDKANAQKR